MAIITKPDEFRGAVTRKGEIICKECIDDQTWKTVGKESVALFLNEDWKGLFICNRCGKDLWRSDDEKEQK